VSTRVATHTILAGRHPRWPMKRASVLPVSTLRNVEAICELLRRSAGLLSGSLGRCSAAEAFRTDLADAGFSVEPEEQQATPVMEAATPNGLIDWCLAFGLARMLADQPESVSTAWRRTC